MGLAGRHTRDRQTGWQAGKYTLCSSEEEELIQLEFATEPISGTEAMAKVQPRERYKLVSSLCPLLYISMLIDTLWFLLSF